MQQKIYYSIIINQRLSNVRNLFHNENISMNAFKAIRKKPDKFELIMRTLSGLRAYKNYVTFTRHTFCSTKIVTIFYSLIKYYKNKTNLCEKIVNQCKNLKLRVRTKIYKPSETKVLLLMRCNYSLTKSRRILILNNNELLS